MFFCSTEFPRGRVYQTGNCNAQFANQLHTERYIRVTGPELSEAAWNPLVRDAFHEDATYRVTLG